MISAYQKYRILEILPGLSIWLTLVGCVVLSFTSPVFMIYVILIFDVYWLLRVIYFSSYLGLSWFRFRSSIKIDWLAKTKLEFPDWVNKKQAIFLPIYNESYDVVAATLNSLLQSNFPKDQMYIIITGEERKKEHWEAIKPQIAAEFKDKFADIIFNTHAADLPDEIPGKGSNIASAEQTFKKYADDHGWNYLDIIVSVFDIDTVAHKEYFANLTYMYCRHPRPAHSSFQPLTLYNNNLWESPSVLRIMAFGTSFWMLFSMARLDNLVTFSSHSMSFQALVDCGFHPKNIVSEDSRIFYQCWLHYGGDYEVTPLYIPVSMDTVREDSIWRSLKNLYFQQRRWAWGAEHIPFLLWEYKKHPEIKFREKFVKLFHEWEGKWSWGVVAILITVLGRLPLYVAPEAVRQSALYFNTPYVLENLMTLSMFGLVFSMIMSMLILPRRPEGHSPHKYLFMVAQWILVPISLIIFSAIPCIDAVTHLMFGKYLGFNVSAKKRV